MKAASFSYSGTDNLEAMRLAPRYNAHLVGLIERFARPGDEMLDFGAGLGLFADAIRTRGHEVRCLEVDEKLARDLARRGFACSTAPDEMADASVDYIYTLNVLEHIDDDVSALRALAPKLRRGGRLLAYVPAFPVLYSAMDRLVGHHRRYTSTTLASAMERAGFRVEYSAYVDSLGFPASLAYRAIGGSGVLNPGSVALYDHWLFPASRIIDRVTHRWIGKNVYCLARRN